MITVQKTTALTPVFIDASSAILLEKSNLFFTFSNIFQVIMAPSVFKEITKPGYRGSKWFKTMLDQGAFTVTALSCVHNDKSFSFHKKFGQGEKETICLYFNTPFKTQKSFILIDDGPAAKWCTAQNIPFINALLVPKIFCYANLITKDDCTKKMELLCRIGRYSKKIKEMAFAFTCNDLSFFIPEYNNEN